MSKIQKGSEHSRYYRTFLGLNLSEDPSDIGEMRLSSMDNMYRDYYGNDGASIETVPGYRKIFSIPSYDGNSRINSLFFYSPKGEDREFVAVHAGKRLFRFPIDERDYATSLSLIPLIYTESGVELSNDSPLQNKKSTAFEYDGRLFILDGKNYFCLDGDKLRYVKDIAYIPTTYSDFKQYEQRNLMTDEFRCVCHLPNNTDGFVKHIRETEGLIYSITGPDTCRVEGANGTQTELYIPSYAEINGRSYLIEEIAPYAFRGFSEIRRVKIDEGVKKIGYGAFYSCASLTHAHLPNSVETLGNGIFMHCSSLKSVTIGYGITKIPIFCFYETALTNVFYTGTQEQWGDVVKEDRNPPLPSATVSYGYYDRSGKFIFQINELCQEVLSVKLDGEEISQVNGDVRYELLSEDGYISAVVLETTDVNLIFSKELIISGRGKYGALPNASDYKPISQTRPDYNGLSYQIISECTVSAIFDGKIFFAGNPKFPSTVFYTAKTKDGIELPEYIGALNYFSVGRSDSAVVSLLPSGENLIIFKQDSEKGGIYIHYGSDSGYDVVPRIYPCVEAINGLGAMGESCNFYDDTVFISDRGLDAVTRKSFNSELTIEHRSSNIDLALLRGKIKDALLCRWLGYLVIALEGDIFLADSRQTFRHKSGDSQYEWYRLSGIGTYEGQYKKFRFCPLPSEFEKLSVLYEDRYISIEEKEEGEPNDREVLSSYAFRDNDNGYEQTDTMLYYIAERDEDGVYHCYLCDCDGEMTGGVFRPVSALCNANDLLLFGTESGDVCCFNTDKRDEYGNIDSRYYSFDNRRYISGFTTLADNCGIPHLAKTTVKRSLCIHLKSFGSGRVKIGVHTERNGWRDVAEAQSTVFAFDDIEFDNFSFNTSQRIILPLAEKEKRWVEKQYHVFSDEYKRPFGVFDMSYRYKVAGRIKE